MERRYECTNGVVEQTRYPVGVNAKPRRAKQKGHTTFRKQEANFNSSLRTVARLLNCNYTHENGLLLTLDYDEAGLNRLIAGLAPEHQEALEKLRLPAGEIGTWSMKKQGGQTGAPEEAEQALEALRDAAERQMLLWLRRVKRKHAGPVKALMVTSDADHSSGELVRVHHHIPLAAEGISWDLLQSEWKFGSVDIKQMRDQKDYTPIAVYLMRQVRRRPEKSKYRVTRGMVRPKVTEREILSHAEIRAPAGAQVLERSEFSVENVTQYIRYVPRKQESRRKRKTIAEEDEP